MNIYCEFLLDRIRIKIDGEEISFQVNNTFYTQRMMIHAGISSRVRGFVLYHQSGLSFFEKLSHLIVKNKVYILVSQEVQQLVTLRQIHHFAARFLEGGTMYIIPKPTAFDSTELEHIEKIGAEYIRENQNRDTVIAQLRSMARPASPAFK